MVVVVMVMVGLSTHAGHRTHLRECPVENPDVVRRLSVRQQCGAFCFEPLLGRLVLADQHLVHVGTALATLTPVNVGEGGG